MLVPRGFIFSLNVVNIDREQVSAIYRLERILLETDRLGEAIPLLLEHLLPLQAELGLFILQCLKGILHLSQSLCFFLCVVRLHLSELLTEQIIHSFHRWPLEAFSLSLHLSRLF